MAAKIGARSLSLISSRERADELAGGSILHPIDRATEVWVTVGRERRKETLILLDTLLVLEDVQSAVQKADIHSILHTIAQALPWSPGLARALARALSPLAWSEAIGFRPIVD